MSTTTTTSDDKSFKSAKSTYNDYLLNFNFNSKYVKTTVEELVDIPTLSKSIEKSVEKRRLRNLNRKNHNKGVIEFRNLDSPLSSSLESEKLIPIHTRQRTQSDSVSNNSLIYKLNHVKPISTEDLMFRIKPKSVSTDDIIYSSLKSESVDVRDNNSVDFRHDILYKAINASFGDETTPTNKSKSNFLNTDPFNGNGSSSRHRHASTTSTRTPQMTRRKSSLSLSRPKPTMSVDVNHVNRIDFPVETASAVDVQPLTLNPLPVSNNTTAYQKRTSTIRKSLSTPLLSEQDNDVLESPPLPVLTRQLSKKTSHSSIPNLKSSTIERRNKPPALELYQSTHKEVDNKLKGRQEQRQDYNLLSPDTNKSTHNSSATQGQMQLSQGMNSNSWATGISSETYFARPSQSNQIMNGLRNKLSNLPKLTRMRAETLPSPSPTTPNSFDPAYANGVGVAVYGYGGGFGNGGYGYNKSTGGSSKSPNRLKQRPSSSPTFPTNSNSSYSVARLKGMLEQHVAQERNMWHTIASNTTAD